MIAKLVAYGKDRTEAIARMLRAIDEYKYHRCEKYAEVWGVCHHSLIPEFVSGKFDTHFVAKHFKPEYLKREDAGKITGDR
jgi:acetyl/propionyl-CoA carboxylase alpha subunit